MRPRPLIRRWAPSRSRSPRCRAGSFTPRCAQGTAPTRRPGFDDHQLVRRGHDGARYPPPPGVHDRCGPERGRSPKITDAVCDAVLQWQRRPLEAFLPRDLPRARSAPMAPRRPPGCPARGGCIAVGAAVDGLLSTRGIWVQADEGAFFWAHVCAELSNRGVAGRA